MFRALVFVGLIFFAFQGQPSKAVRAKLFRQVLADDAELRECLKEQEGGAAAADCARARRPSAQARSGIVR